VAAQHRVLVPEYQQLSILRHVPAERQDSEAEYPANQHVDDPDQHLARQPSPRQACWRWRGLATQSSIRAAQDRDERVRRLDDQIRLLTAERDRTSGGGEIDVVSDDRILRNI